RGGWRPRSASTGAAPSGAERGAVPRGPCTWRGSERTLEVVEAQERTVRGQQHTDDVEPGRPVPVETFAACPLGKPDACHAPDAVALCGADALQRVGGAARGRRAAGDERLHLAESERPGARDDQVDLALARAEVALHDPPSVTLEVRGGQLLAVEAQRAPL